MNEEPVLGSDGQAQPASAATQSPAASTTVTSGARLALPRSKPERNRRAATWNLATSPLNGSRFSRWENNSVQRDRSYGS